MSFFKKLTKEFDELGLGSKQKKDNGDTAYSGEYLGVSPLGAPSFPVRCRSSR
jgi:hypothetical protein